MLLQELIYPQLYRYILHPCVSWPGNPDMCGGLHTATGDLRFDSFLTQEDVVIMLIYEVSHACLVVAHDGKLKGLLKPWKWQVARQQLARCLVREGPDSERVWYLLRRLSAAADLAPLSMGKPSSAASFLCRCSPSVAMASTLWSLSLLWTARRCRCCMRRNTR